MALVVRDKATTWDVGLTHKRLSRNNPSTVVFHLHPDSTHHHIWRDAEYGEVQHQTQHPITGLTTVEILQQEFLDRDADFLYPKLSQLLPPSLDELDPRQREELVLQIIARAYVVLLDYSKYFPTAVNLLMRVYLNIVTTYSVSFEFEGEDHTLTPAAPSDHRRFEGRKEGLSRALLILLVPSAWRIFQLVRVSPACLVLTSFIGNALLSG